MKPIPMIWMRRSGCVHRFIMTCSNRLRDSWRGLKRFGLRRIMWQSIYLLTCWEGPKGIFPGIDIISLSLNAQGTSCSAVTGRRTAAEALSSAIRSTCSTKKRYRPRQSRTVIKKKTRIGRERTHGFLCRFEKSGYLPAAFQRD